MDNGKRPFEDDGRTVADMSEVGGSFIRFPHLSRNRKTGASAKESNEDGRAFRPDRAERRAIIGGALSAGLVVSGALALGFALLILLIQWIW